jgi:hypothetical protein
MQSAGGRKRKTVGGRSGPGGRAYGGHLTAVCKKHCAARFRPGRAGSRAGHWLDAPTLDALSGARAPGTERGKSRSYNCFREAPHASAAQCPHCCPCVCRRLQCSSAVPRRRGAPSAAICALVCPIERWEIGSYQRDPAASTRSGSSRSHEGEPRPDRAVLADVVPF